MRQIRSRVSKGKMKIKFCPNCRSKEIRMVAGGITGIYKCKKCGFQSAIFPEIEINEKDTNKKSLRKK